MSENNLTPVERLPKRTGLFTNYIYKTIPLAFDESMSYYETLCGLLSYLKDTMKPVVDNNAVALQELQDYVVHYFDNLDVQEEIDNKLDNMVEDGTLDEIINQEIFGDLNDDIEDLQNDLTTLETTLTNEIDGLQRNALYIGNSYIDGVGSTGNNNGIFERTKNLFNNSYKKTSGGIGFLTYTEHSETFITRLTSAINDDNIPNDEITDIIVVSAWGDTRALHESDTWNNYRSNLQTAIGEFITLATNNFPNLKRVCCMLGESRSQKHIDDSTVFQDAFWVHQIFKEIMPKNGMEYLGWIGFNLLLTSMYFSSDHYHPNDAGYKLLASLFKTSYSGTLEYTTIKRNWSSRPCEITNGSTLGGFIELTPENATLTIQSLTLAQGSTPSNNDNTALLLDFGNNLPFSLPMPLGQTTAMNLSSGFICTTQSPTAADFDASNNYMARVNIKPSSDMDSTAIGLNTYGGSKTISNTTVNSICTPFQFKWSLQRFL